ncbi:sterol 3beta-glucosyltransferase [Thalassospira sp. MBR-102]|jgi:UDP:flavonoid glycosyltransferase YjiC (YdhE family)|uniref:glycosyltransferase n=1 Tax=Thalassospira sp. MBR-102 TaxID=3156466 RepID=UPI0033947410
MHILLMTYGTRGDIQPFIALAYGLQQTGHMVTLAAPGRFQSLVQQHGLAFAPLTDALINLTSKPQFANASNPGTGFLKKISSILKLRAQGRDLQGALLDDIFETINRLRPDKIVFHPKAFGALAIADHFAIPAILAQLIPALIPTRAYPHIGFPNMSDCQKYNLLTGKLVKGLVNLSLRNSLRDWASKRHKAIPYQKFDILKSQKFGAITILNAYSNAIIARPNDWPKKAAVTGYWFVNDALYEPSTEMTSFIKNSQKLIYIGFGSMPAANPQKTAQMLIDAVKQANAQAIIATGWGGIASDVDWPSNIYAVREVPHEWMFKHVKTAIHHGGAGTCAAALRAGCPSIIVPFFGDQPFWAKRLYTIGVAHQLIPSSKLDAKCLASAISDILATPQVHETAKRIAKQISHENGVATAVDLILNGTEIAA